MNIRFQKTGIVTVGTAEEGQEINLENPIGKVTQFHVDLVNETFHMTIEATDGLNSVAREYPIQLTPQDWGALILGFFTNNIRPAAKAQYDEFKDLVEIPQ